MTRTKASLRKEVLKVTLPKKPYKSAFHLRAFTKNGKLDRIVSCVYEIAKSHGKEEKIWDNAVDEIKFGATLFNPQQGPGVWVKSAHYKTAQARYIFKPVTLKLQPAVVFRNRDNFNQFVRERIREIGVADAVGTVDTTGINYDN